MNASISPLSVILEFLYSSETFLRTFVNILTEAPKSKTEFTAKKLNINNDIINATFTIAKVF